MNSCLSSPWRPKISHPSPQQPALPLTNITQQPGRERSRISHEWSLTQQPTSGGWQRDCMERKHTQVKSHRSAHAHKCTLWLTDHYRREIPTPCAICRRASMSVCSHTHMNALKHSDYTHWGEFTKNELCLLIVFICIHNLHYFSIGIMQMRQWRKLNMDGTIPVHLWVMIKVQPYW